MCTYTLIYVYVHDRIACVMYAVCVCVDGTEYARCGRMSGWVCLVHVLSVSHKFMYITVNQKRHTTRTNISTDSYNWLIGNWVIHFITLHLGSTKHFKYVLYWVSFNYIYVITYGMNASFFDCMNALTNTIYLRFKPMQKNYIYFFTKSGKMCNFSYPARKSSVGNEVGRHSLILKHIL